MPVAIVGFIATLGVPGLATAAGTLTTLGSVLAGAVGLGISYGLNALLGKTDSPKPADVKGIIRQSLPTRKKYRGRVRTGGAMFFIQTNNGRLHMGIYFGEGPCDAIEEWYVDERAVTLNADGFILQSPYGGRVRIQFRLGAAPSTHYVDLATTFPTIWSSSHRGDGWISCYVLQSGIKPEHFNNVYPNRYCQVNTVRRDGKAYDPRTGLTAWTANLPLILRDFLIDPDGAQIDPAYIDDTDIAAAATYADGLLPTSGGGTVRRYHGQLAYDMASEPGEAIQRCLTATDGRLFLKPSGKIGFIPGRWIEPTVLLPDAAIIAYELSDGGGPLREANEVKVNYTNPLTRYSEAECDPWREEDDISLSGQVKSVSIDAYEIQSHHHARRIAKLRARRAGADWNGTITYDLRGMEAWDQRFIRAEVLDLGIDYGAFEIQDAQMADDGLSVTYQVLSTGPDNWQLSFAEEGTPPADPLSLEEGSMPIPQNLHVVASSRDVSGGQRAAVLTATWDAAADRDDLSSQAQYSKADAETWLEMAVAESATEAQTIGLEDGSAYDVRVRWVGAAGSVGDWVLVENTSVRADPVAPLSLTAFLASDSAPRLGKVSFGISTGNDAHLKTVKLYRKATGVPLNLSVDTPVATLIVASLGSYSYTDGDSSRTNLIANPAFDTDTLWTKGTGWTIAGGKASKVAGSTASIQQAISDLSTNTGSVYRFKFTMFDWSAGTANVRLLNGTLVSGASYGANGTYLGKLTSVAGNTAIGVAGTTAFVGSIDDFVLYRETLTSAPQGSWDYYALPFNGSNVPGPASGPIAVTII